MFKEKVKDLYGEELPELFVDCVLDKNNSKDVESIKCIEDTRKKTKENLWLRQDIKNG